MATVVHAFDWPDRFVTGTVGPPGSRTFYLQVRDGVDVVSVGLEKQQAAALADRVDAVLDELMAEDGNPYSIPALVPDGLADDEALDQPVDEQFRTRVIALGWDPSTAQVVIEAFPISDDVDLDAVDPAELEPPEVLVVRIPVGSARAFAKRTRDVVAAGRPVCSLCQEPMDSDDHVCTLPDGFR